ncbi:EF-P lysine aminoacylase GenX, partial [Rhizobium ruizarguesonis]
MNSSANASNWWTPSVHADRRPFMIGRNAIQAALSGFFSREDFIEVYTAVLHVSPGNEA